MTDESIIQSNIHTREMSGDAWKSRMEKKLIDALQLNYHEIAQKFAQHVSGGNKNLDIKDVAVIYLYSAQGIVTDMEFQQYISDALGNPDYKFSSENAPVVKSLIEKMKTDQFPSKHPLLKMLRDKLPLEPTKSASGPSINHNTKFQMLAIKDAVQKDPELKRMLEQQSLEHALESDPQHLFSMILSIKDTQSPALEEKLHKLKERCLREHYHRKK